MSCVSQPVNAGRLLAPSRVRACAREWWCAMLKRALKLAEAKKKAETTKPAAKRPSPADFSLRESPLSRVLCFQVGRGQAATTMQNIAQAAVSEAGAGNVSKSSCAACVAKPFRFNLPKFSMFFPLNGLALLNGRALLNRRAFLVSAGIRGTA